MKKILTICMICISAALILAGCSNKSIETTTTQQTTTTPTTTETDNNTTQSSSEQSISSNIFGNLVEDVGDYKRFKTTRKEFISRYNQLAKEKGLKEILESNYISNADDDRSNEEIVAENRVGGVANVYTYSLDDWRATESVQEFGFLVDEEDKITQLVYGTKNNSKEFDKLGLYTTIICLAMDESISTTDVHNLLKEITEKGAVQFKDDSGANDWGTKITSIEGEDAVSFEITVFLKE